MPSCCRRSAARRRARLLSAIAVLTATLPAALAPSAGARPAGRHAHRAAAASAPAPLLTWSRPRALAPSGWRGEASALTGLACPSRAHCAAADRDGIVFTTSRPTSARPSAWHRARLPGAPKLVGIACPSMRLCVAAADDGGVFSSTDPFAAHPLWAAARLRGSGLATGVACASISLCVVVDDAGDASVSTRPASRTSWSTAQIDSATYACTGSSRCQAGLTSVSCPATSACLAFDDSGNLLRSASPAAGPGSWETVAIEDRNRSQGAPPAGCLSGFCVSLACPSSSTCVAADTGGRALTSPEPFGPATAWSIRSLGALGSPTALACAGTSVCELADSAGEILGTAQPAGGPPAWVATRVEPRRTRVQLTALACPAASECVAGDSAGRLFVGVAHARRSAS